ncbi:MAG: PIN domain-containing protein [Thermoproteota archaeon]
MTIVTLVEFPSLLEYSKFQGSVVYPTRSDLDLAVELQLKLRNQGRLKPFSDLLIAAICINRNEDLVTKDADFKEIAEISELKLRVE